MRSSIANLKENLNKIALDVHDDDEEDELGIYGGRGDGEVSPFSDRRLSHGLAYSGLSAFDSLLSNGNDSAYNSEIEQYKTEIKRLRESEAEIKALSINYAALLKEKEDQITRLNLENGSLKQNLDAASATLNASRIEASRASTTGPNTSKVVTEASLGGADQSPNQLNKLSSGKNRLSGNQLLNGIVYKQEGHGNGFTRSLQDDSRSKYSNSMNNEKELEDLVEEKNRSMTAMQGKYEQQIKQLKEELQQECDRSANIQVKFQEEQKRRHSLQEELSLLKQVQDKREKEELEAAPKAKTSVPTASGQPSGSFPGKDELESSLQKLERDLKETRRQRDKASQELARLKQHLLQKEYEESEKMDEDSKIIEELRQHVEYQKGTILNLERALKQAYGSQEEVRNINSNELKKAKDIIADLKEKLASCMQTIDAKNVELSNLHTALGQYYAEIEAKEHLETDLSVSREECSKLAQQLKDLNQQFEVSTRERAEIQTKFMQTENMIAEGKGRVKKLEEDNAKLQRALEQSMTRLNRMSMDSDFLVDRRIVIKLLVTYFQRNHSKEVLDLMVRMLGFSDEDKQRIGFAQQGAGKGVVRGVLGLPGRLVGGILSGGGSTGAKADVTSENHSFADLWVDFLLKESEERVKRESMEAVATGRSNGDQPVSSPSPSASVTQPLGDKRTSKIRHPPAFLNTKPSHSEDLGSACSSYPAVKQSEHPGSEFSMVPLTPSHSSSWDST